MCPAIFWDPVYCLPISSLPVLQQICADAFLGSLHIDHRQGHAGRGLLRMAHLSGSWSNLCIDVQKFRKGLSAVHSDKSAANICKPRQWRSQQSCLAYIALDDRLPVIDSTMRMQCHCDKRRILLVLLKPPATQILTALLLQQRRCARPLGTAHFATNKCQLMQQFATIPVTKFAIRSVRWAQLFSSIWPDLLDIRRVAIT